MDASLIEYLKSLDVHPLFLALAPMLLGFAPKIFEFYVARRRREHETRASRTYLEHLKLHLEIHQLTRDGAENGDDAALPKLPPLPEPIQPLLPLPESNWLERASWGFAGTFIASAPIYLIGALQSDGLTGFEEWGRLQYACTFIAVGLIVAISIAFLPIRQRWSSAMLAASAALFIWAFSGGYIHYFLYHV